MSLPCIGGCVIANEHRASCVGLQWRHGRAVPCDGCLPYPAERGLLCYSCAAKVDDTWDILCDLVTHMRSIERGPAGEIPVRSAPGSRVILPASWQMADETWRTLHHVGTAASLEFDVDEPPLFGTTTPLGFGVLDPIETVRDNVQWSVDTLTALGDQLLQRMRTATAVLQLVRQVQTALTAFPLEERAHQIEYVRCRACGLMTLEWRPPLEYLDLVTVKCRNSACGEIFDPAIAEVDLRELRQQLASTTAAATA